MLKMKMFSAMLAVSAMAFSFGVEADHHHHGGHHHSHSSFGFYFGLPLYTSPYYFPYYPYYYPYYPPGIVTVPSRPPVYIERGSPQSTQQFPAGYWYYCSDPEGYYPYIKECPSGWQQVDPIPPLPR